VSSEWSVVSRFRISGSTHYSQNQRVEEISTFDILSSLFDIRYSSTLAAQTHFMEKISWGIIGCGDVTEIKSGPAFNKIPGSQLVAVMRRDAGKAKDYAARHHVPKWYNDATLLINDPEVNAIYVATPPSTHEEYTIQSLRAGKPVYVEKPMSVDAGSAHTMTKIASETGTKLVVAHYRRAQPLFNKIKELLNAGIIGNTRFVRLELYKKLLSREELAVPKTAWRVNRSIAGGGLFHDLAPHQLDLLYYFFGKAKEVSGLAINQSAQYTADDIATATILFESGIVFNGLWSFNLNASQERDNCEIAGDKGKILFSFFDQQPIRVETDGKTETFAFEPLQHVQQPMIGKVVDHFLGKGSNPCTGEEGAVIMEWIDTITKGK
jgi:predicted dehydrogenase